MALRYGIALLAVAALAAPAPAAAIDWTTHRTLNITHQGGEDEAPSGTMYALERSMRLGADMLEVDVHTTADGHVVVMHDSRVDRTTEGTGPISEMTLAQVRALDAAYDFVPGVGTTTDAEPREYAFRGVRTGEKDVPAGYRRAEFRVPTLEEVMRRYPEVPINIEIKGNADTDFGSFYRNADHLAATLRGIGRTEGIVVASFNDLALERFHQQLPEIDLAPALVETAAYKAAPITLLPGRVALQVPITFEGIQVTDQAFVDNAHSSGYAVHVWLSNDPENDETYRTLLGWNVDGIMAAQPAALERRLCASDVPRPPRPGSWPGAHCRHTRASIACDVVPADVSLAGRALKVRLVRRDEFDGRCAGRVSVRIEGTKAARGRFNFGWVPASEGGPESIRVKLALPRALRRSGWTAIAGIKGSARPYGAFKRTRRLAVR